MRIVPMVLVGMMFLMGCAGTMATRTDQPMDNMSTEPHAMFGGYPFQAVVIDFQMELQGGNDGRDGEGAHNPVEPILFLAVDLVVDLVLLPIDLVTWPFGCHKRVLKSSL